MQIFKWIDQIFEEHTEADFEMLAMELFRYQYHNNALYHSFCNQLGKTDDNVANLQSIPFLPVEFFKTHQVQSFAGHAEDIFLSSGTLGMQQSKHYVKDLDIYIQSFVKSFEYFYGSVSDYTILALLPGYLERQGSSLIFMVDELIALSGQEESGFYLHNHEELFDMLIDLKRLRRKVLLIGVSFALLDFADEYEFRLNLDQTIVMETGGMKGKRKELLREELHANLKKAFGVNEIHSEYGMTELLSQAYSLGDMRFSTPPWMKVMIRDTYDPFANLGHGRTGGINIIDLANVYSCSFIETKDLGKIVSPNKFEVLGRFDNSDIRGCNLMIE